mgnify:CR=1 FL=1
MVERHKAALPLRLFHYALWTTLLLVLIWFIVLPLLSKAGLPQLPAPPSMASP